MGGTGLVGRHLVEAALASGHEPALFERGRTDPGLFPELEHLRGDRDGDLRALGRRVWDAVVDASGFRPAAVAASARVLAGSVSHYTFVSSVSAYADLSAPGVDESAPLAHEPASEGYGPLKAACERVLEREWRRGLLRVRPGVVSGPGDRSGRLAYWPRRIAAGGDVLVPGPAWRPVQVLDARDLAGWLVSMVERSGTGVLNATGPARPFGELVEPCRAETGAGARLVWVDEDFLLAAGVEPWVDLPLWAGGRFAGLCAVDSSRAVAAGLRSRPLAETVLDTLAWDAAHPGASRSRGLSPAREAELLERWLGRHHQRGRDA